MLANLLALRYTVKELPGGILASPLLLTTMEKPVIEEIRDLLQTVLVPQLEGIKGDIRALDAKLSGKIDVVETKIEAVDVKVECFRRELSADIRRVEQVLSAEFVRLEQKVDLRLENMDTKLATMNDKLEFQRRELLAEIRAALR